MSYKDPDNHTVKVELKDMLKISGGYFQQENILESVILKIILDKPIESIEIFGSYFTRFFRV